MKDTDRPDHFAGPERATMTDLRLTRSPADTPRGRLHRLAVTGARAVDELRGLAGFDKEVKLHLRDLARRGIELNGSPRTPGQRLLAALCVGVDLAIYSVMLLDLDMVDALCVGLTTSLVQLEAAENKMHDMAVDLEKARLDVRSARSDVTQLRTLLAQAQIDLARVEVATSEWDEKTRSSTPTRDTKDIKKKTAAGPEVG